MIKRHKTYKDIIKELPWEPKPRVINESEKIKPSYTTYYSFRNDSIIQSTIIYTVDKKLLKYVP